jgi:hypothetical protein
VDTAYSLPMVYATVHCIYGMEAKSKKNQHIWRIYLENLDKYAVID